MTETLDDKPTILKKKKKIPAEGHGGPWKIAYADFVTAMMAFFLLLWLLNASTEEQMQGISDYFAPINVSDSKTGIGEALKGLEVLAEGAMRSATARPKIRTEVPTFGDEETGEEDGQQRASSIEANPESGSSKTNDKDKEALEIAMAQLRQSLEEVPELSELQSHLSMEILPEGLRIQILDQRDRSMFEGNSSRLTGFAKRLLALIGAIASELPNNISLSGHTDGGDYRSINPAYGKWELTADKAAAAHQWLTDAGLPRERFVSIVGKSDTDLLDTEDPEAPRNRRISILLLNQVAQ